MLCKLLYYKYLDNMGGGVGIDMAMDRKAFPLVM